MRVVGGRWKGRPLAAPAGRETRPTSDRVREAIFDVLLALPELGQLAPDSPESAAGSASAESAPAEASLSATEGGPLVGHRALDLCAGSGALGIEALSRGAAACTFVESSAAAVRALRGNLERLGVPVVRREVATPRAAAPSASAAPPSATARVLATDVRRALSADARDGARYTLVLADPPYDLYTRIRPALARLLARVLTPGAVLVIETSAATRAELPWTVVREKRYGDTRVTFLVADASRPTEGVAAEDDRQPS